MNLINRVSIFAIVISLIYIFYMIHIEHYIYALMLYFVCVALFFFRLWVKYKLEETAKKPTINTVANHGFYVAEKLYALFRSKNENINKDVYTTEICKLYVYYKKYRKIDCNSNNYSTLCAYFDFEYYADEYLNNLPKF